MKKLILICCCFCFLAGCEDRGLAPDDFVSPIGYTGTEEEAKKVKAYIARISKEGLESEKFGADSIIKGLEVKGFKAIVERTKDKAVLEEVIRKLCYEEGACSYFFIRAGYVGKMKQKNKLR